jgi:phenylalanyl-tRNA synthetase beta chain
MNFSYNWLQSFFTDKLPSPEKLADLLTMHAFEVDNVSKRDNDQIIDIDILPNRAADCLSHFGLAREIKALLGISHIDSPYGESSFSIYSKSQTESGGVLEVAIEKDGLCPRYTALVIEGVEIVDSPDWMKERLASMDQKSINNVVDLTNFIVWELGQPLHAFDMSKIKGGKLTVRSSKIGEVLETLDGMSHKLDQESIIIEDTERIVDLAGIKGGANTQIDKSTNTIILQAAVFDPVRIRKTSQSLGIRTDASYRYMQGMSTRFTEKVLERAFELLQKTNAAAKIVQRVDVYKEVQSDQTIFLDVSYTNSLLGLGLAYKDIEDLLDSLGFDHKAVESKNGLEVKVPPHRLDMRIQEDLIEEIARTYGYENISESAPRGRLIVPRRNEHVFWRSMGRQILTGFGFSEVYNYSFVSEDIKLIFNQTDDASGQKNNVYPWELINPISDEFKYLRPMLLLGMLRNQATNAKFFQEAKIFEFGNIFQKNEEKIAEYEHFGMAISSPKEDKGAEGFYELKGYADEFFKKMGLLDFYFDPALSSVEESIFSFLHPFRRVNIVLNNEKVGYLGEIHPLLYDELGIEGIRVYCMEVNFERIASRASEEHFYQAPSKYPDTIRDIALLVPREVRTVDILNVVNQAGGALLADVDLFDMYEGGKLSQGIKSLAFHLIFQSEDRTLTSEEVDDIMEQVYKALEAMDWEVRR